eukprot:g7977.t1
MSDDIDAIWAEMRAESTYKKPLPTNLSSCQRDKHKEGDSNGLFKLQGGYGTAQSVGGGQQKKKGGTVTDFSWLQNYGIKQVAPPSSASSSSGVVKKTAASVGASSAAWTPITAASGIYGGSSFDPDGISTTDAENRSRRGEAAEDDPNSLNFEPIAESVPLDSPEAFLAHFQRDLNILSDESTTNIDLKTRLRAVKKLELVVVKNVDALSSDILDCAQEELLKPLLKRIQRDSSEKIRELSAQILTKLVENAPNPLTSHGLNFVIPILVSRVGCEDLDGVAHLPPVMRPNPEQRPVEIQTPVEPSEEVRRTLAELIEGIVQRISTQQVLSFVDELTGLLRALCMDPFSEVKQLGCEILQTFCYNHHDVLLHFTEPMGRSLTSCLVHNHFKLRISALQALTAVLHCGTWKHNHEVFQLLVAWQDPNSVPTKSFYEHVTTVNYFSSLTFDRHPAVRRFWFETLGLLEACGAQYEVDNEKDLREKKQYGLDAEWTYGGKNLVPFPLQGRWRDSVRKRTQAQGPDFKGERAEKTRALDLDEDGLDGDGFGEDEVMELPQRDYSWHFLDCLYVSSKLPRPRLGARMWVRTHIRRFIKALFNNVLDFRECNMLNAAKLLIMCIAYAEDNATEWLSSISEALIKFYAGKAYLSGSQELAEAYDLMGKLIGSYADPNTIWLQYEDSFAPDTVWYLEQRLGVFHLLTNMLDGAIGSLERVSSATNFTRGEKLIGRGTKPCESRLGLLDGMLPKIVGKLLGCDLLQECTASDGLPVAETLWNLVAMLARLGEEKLSRELRCKLLVLSVALVAGLKGGDSEGCGEMGTSGSDFTTAASTARMSTVSGFRNATAFSEEDGNAFFAKVSCPLTLRGASRAAAAQTKHPATPALKDALTTAERSNAEKVYSPLEKLQLISARLNVRVEDVDRDLVQFTKENFAPFRAFCRLLPIHRITEVPAIWEGLRGFTAAHEESQTRMAALRLCVELLQREDDWYLAGCPRSYGEGNLGGKKAFDMSDIDDDEDVPYESKRKRFIASMFDCFVPILENATVSPPDKPKQKLRDLAAEKRDAETEKAREERKAVDAGVAALVEIKKDVEEGKVSVEESIASAKEALKSVESLLPPDSDDEAEEGVKKSVADATKQKTSEAAAAEAEEAAEEEEDADEAASAAAGAEEEVRSSAKVQTTPFHIVQQTLAVLRGLIVAKFQQVEVISRSAHDSPHFQNSDLLTFAPLPLFKCLSALTVDVEYYKRVARMMEQQERIALNKTDSDDLTAVKNKEIREISLDKAVQARASAAEVLFFLLRSRFNANSVATTVVGSKRGEVGKKAKKKTSAPETIGAVSPTDELEYNVVLPAGSTSSGENKRGKVATRNEEHPLLKSMEECLVVSATQDHPLWELREIFADLRKLIKTKHTATLQPFFIRPTAPALLLFASEMLRMFLQAPSYLLQQDSIKAQLYDDAARQILNLPMPHFQDLEIKIVEESGEFFGLVSDVVLQLMDLNLSLPPVPNHPLTPIVSSAAEGKALAEERERQLANAAAGNMVAVDPVLGSGGILGDGSMDSDPIPVGWILPGEGDPYRALEAGKSSRSAASSSPKKGAKDAAATKGGK